MNYNKAIHVKCKVDVFVDDDIDNFIKLNLSGIPCLLLDKPYNQEWGPVARLFTFNTKEIEECYNLFMNTMFPYFKELVDDTRD